MIKLTVFNSPDDIALHTYKMLTAAAGESEKAAAALSFGSTYEGIFRKWRDLWRNEGKPALPAFFPADERRVGFDHPASNWGVACGSFISDCGTGDDTARWASDSESYRSMLGAWFGGSEKLTEPPEFSLMFLGLGPDGHTASLFPGDCPEQADPDWMKPVLETTAPFDPPSRLTLGPEVIAWARKLVLVVTGASKVEIFGKFLHELSESESDGTRRGFLPPVRIIRRRRNLGLDTMILCDAAASASIEKSIIDRSGWVHDIQTNR